MTFTISDKWFYLGLGAAVGVLLAPKSGKEMRGTIASKGQELRDTVVSRLHETGVADSSSQTLHEIVERGKEVVERGRNVASNVASIGRQRLNDSIEAGKRKFNESIEDEETGGPNTISR